LPYKSVLIAPLLRWWDPNAETSILISMFLTSSACYRISKNSTPIHREIVTVAISLGAPTHLTRRKDQQPRDWLNSVLGDKLDCDEYPYASTHQRGPNGLSYFALNTPADNRSAGATLGLMYTFCNLSGTNQGLGDAFEVFPIAPGNGAITSYTCK
jgi:hypothetical protein